MDPIPARTCPECGEAFSPKPRGYNAVYCSKACKERRWKRGRRPKPYSAADRRKWWNRIKEDPDLLAKIRAQGRASAGRVREWLQTYKVQHGCVDCGYKGHFAALQLDHTKDKVETISAARSSVGRLMLEIERGGCVVRCANCHALRTWEREQWKKGSPRPRRK